MKYAIITGSSKGIGKAIAEKLAADGFSLALCARGMESLEALKNLLTARHPNIQVYIQSVDMGDTPSVRSFAQNILQHFQQAPDILVNNAGIYLPGPLENEPEGQIERLMAVNVFSAYHLTRSLLASIKEKGSGHIFNICSTASHSAYDNGGSYSITKHALLGFNKNLREELKSTGIRVTSISPGPTWTASWEGFEAPENRFMQASDIADILYAAYQLSPQAVVEDIVLRPQLGDLTNF
jgi:short-subunit dehydrogenase